MLQELQVLHVISSGNGRYRPQACSWPEAALGQKRTVQQWPNKSMFRLGGFSESVELQRAADEQSTLDGYLSASSFWSKTAYSAIAAKYTHMFSNIDF